MNDLSTELVSMENVNEAAQRIDGICYLTPLIESPKLNAQLGGRLFLKCENLQITGSFKIRGAFNRLSMISSADKDRQIVARSSGNHGIAVAYSSNLLGLRSTIVVPKGTPTRKLQQIKALGAEIVTAETPSHTAALTDDVVKKSQGLLVPPAGDPNIIAGAATVGLETIHQANSLGVELDAMLVCCSGGGLAAGCTLAFGALSPGTEVHIVEPWNMDKMARSIAAGHTVKNPVDCKTICDSLAGPIVGELPLEILKSRLTAAHCVNDAEVRDAMVFAAQEFGLVVEPGGVVALAAVLAGKISLSGKCVALTLTGRNVDLTQFSLER